MGRIVADHLTPVLKPLGLRKSGAVYRADRGGLWWLIDVQESGWNSSDQVQLTLNAGVYVPGVLATYSGRPEPKLPGPGDCCITARVGMLMPERKDLWWKLTSADADAGVDETVGREVAQAASSILLPFLERFREGRDVSRFLESNDPEFRYVLPQNPAIRLAYAAILHHAEGCRRQSCDLLDAAVLAGADGPLGEHLRALRSRLCEGASGGAV